MATRPEALTRLAQACLAVACPHPVRVAIDGCSAAGKTTLADELAHRMRELSTRPVIRIGIDYFTRAVAARTAYPLDSPGSYYFDSWDYDAFRDQVLAPLGPDAEQRYLSKYLPAERRYVTEVRPRDRADIVVENEDVTAPRVVVRAELPNPAQRLSAPGGLPCPSSRSMC